MSAVVRTLTICPQLILRDEKPYCVTESTKPTGLEDSIDIDYCFTQQCPVWLAGWRMEFVGSHISSSIVVARSRLCTAAQNCRHLVGISSS